MRPSCRKCRLMGHLGHGRRKPSRKDIGDLERRVSARAAEPSRPGRSRSPCASAEAPRLSPSRMRARLSLRCRALALNAEQPSKACRGMPCCDFVDCPYTGYDSPNGSRQDPGSLRKNEGFFKIVRSNTSVAARRSRAATDVSRPCPDSALSFSYSLDMCSHGANNK